MTEEKKLKVIFAPGCFDNFDGNQEELDEMIAKIHEMVGSGELLKNSRPVDVDELLEELSEDEMEHLLNQLDEALGTEETVNSTRKLH